MKLCVKLSTEVCGDVNVLLDTCADTNVISGKLVERLNLNIIPSVGKGGLRSVGASVSVCGKTVCCLNGVNYEFNVINEDLSEEAGILIGWPTLVKSDFKIKSHNCEVVVELCGKLVNVVGNSKKLNKSVEVRSVDVRVAEEAIINQGEQKVVKIKYNKDSFKDSNTNSVFILPSMVLKGTPLRLAAGTLPLNNNKIIIANLGSEEIKLKKGALVGYASSGVYQVLNLNDDELEGLEDGNVEVGMGLSKKEIKEEIERIKEENNNNNNNYTHPRFKIGILQDLLVRWKRLFAGDSPGVSTKTNLYVNLKDPNSTPVRERPRRLPFKALDVVREMVKDMLEKKVIEPVESAWAFPIVLAKKSDGSWRFCVDYSKLNDMVVKDSFPLPNIEEMVDELKEAKVLSVVDLASGFWQIPVHESAKEKLAFVTHFGTYTFNGMPFGFVNSPGIFQRAINETLDPLLFRCCMVYVDDVIIYSKSWEDHINHLDAVFTLLNKYNWKIKLKKCKFMKTKIDYLGYRVGNGEVEPADKNIDKLINMKQPSTPEEMESLLGLTGYYKKFIQGYGYITKPLRKYVENIRKDKKKINFNLGDDEEAMEAYNNLLKYLSDKPILKIFDPTKDIIVKSDTSGFAWGGVLCQVYDGVEFPVCFASGTLNSSQRNWPAWKREAYGSLRCIEKWKYYLIGNTFKLVTDHKANIYLMDPLEQHAPMIQNWKIILSQYDYKVEHRPGKTLVLEDSLSRSPNLLLLNLEDLKTHQQDDILLNKIKVMVGGSEVVWNDDEEKKLKGLKKSFVVEDDVLYFITSYNKLKPHRSSMRVVLSDSVFDDVFNLCHNLELSGHFGMKRTYEKLSSEYWCFDMYSKCDNRFKCCVVCQKNKITKLNNIENIQIVPQEPFDILQMDYIDVTVESDDGYKYILCVCDVFSGKVWYLPSKTRKADEAYILLFTHIFSPFFFPRFLYSDVEASLSSELNNLICKATGIRREYTRPGSIGHTGQVENKNKILEIYITKFINEFKHKDWDKFCPLAAYAYNKSINSINNLSPDFILFGKNPFSLVELSYISDKVVSKEDYVKKFVDSWNETLKIVKKSLQKVVGVKSKETKSKRMIKVGDWVLLSCRELVDNNKINNKNNTTNRKFSNRNIGPYRVVNLDDRNHVLLQITPTKTYETRKSEIELFIGGFTENMEAFTPYLDETIPILIPKLNNNIIEKIGKDKDKKDLDIYSIVGKRINVYWPSEKKWYKATVIGYTNDMKSSLLFYDNDEGVVERREDYFKGKLFADTEKARVEKWSLLVGAEL